MKFINRILFAASSVICVSALMLGCKPEAQVPESVGSIAFIHASPGSPGVEALIDNRIVSQGRINYLQSSVASPGQPQIYVPIRTGNREIRISPDSGRTTVFNANLNVETGRIYTAIAYDTLNGGRIRGVVLNDDLTLPTTGNTRVRFLHLAPNAPTVDVTLLRTSATPNDSVTISGRSFIGANPNAGQLSTFISVPGGTYTARVKLAGTQTVVASVPLTAANTSLAAGRIVTLFATGTARSLPLALGGARNF
jgi:hypothetical protein